MKQKYSQGDYVQVVGAANPYFKEIGIVEDRASALGFYYVRITTGSYKGCRARLWATDLDPHDTLERRWSE